MIEDHVIASAAGEINIKILAEIKQEDIPVGGKLVIASYHRGKEPSPKKRRRYVAMVGNGVTAYSDDRGLTWMPTQGPTYSTYQAVTWTGDHFVAVGSSSSAIRSPDAINWTGANSVLPGSMTYYSVATNGSRCIATGSVAGTLGASNDGGATWSRSALPIPTSTSLRAVIYAAGKFVAVGLTNALYSTDGVTWQSSSLPGNGTYSSLVYNGTRFLASSVSGVAYSDDGITWTPSNFPLSSEIGRAITVGTDFLVLRANTAPVEAYRSTDNGETWVNITMNVGFVPSALMSEVNGNNVRLFAGGPAGAGAYSDDGGTSWTNAPVTGASFGIVRALSYADIDFSTEDF